MWPPGGVPSGPLGSTSRRPLAFAPALRHLHSRLFLHSSGERVQPGRWRLRDFRPSRHSRPRDWHLEARVDLGEPLVSLDVLTLADDAIAECNAARAALQLAHIEATSRLTIRSLA